VRITLLPHALEQKALRGITEEQVRLTVKRPERVGEGRFGCTVAECRSSDERGGDLVRVPYDVGQDEAVVVTLVENPRGGSQAMPRGGGE